MRYREISCKTALNPSRLPGLDYSLNPYLGCEHACVYCYAPVTLHYAGDVKWGEFASAKTNIPAVLEKEARKKKPGMVGLSTVCDPYQPLEKKLELTRKCLDVLLVKNFPVCIQTKSSLVLRDIDLIKEFKTIELGMTVTTLDDRLSKLIEPGAAPASERIRTLRHASDQGIDTWAFIGPVIPGIMDADGLAVVLEDIKSAGVSRVMIDRLRLKDGMWNNILNRLQENEHDIASDCINALFHDDGFFASIRDDAVRLCEGLGLKYEICY